VQHVKAGSWKSRILEKQDPGKAGSRIKDRGSRIEDRGSGIGDRGSGIYYLVCFFAVMLFEKFMVSQAKRTVSLTVGKQG